MVFDRSVTSLGTVEGAVKGGPRDAERPADRGDVGLPSVVESLGEGKLLRIGQLLRPATQPPSRPRRRQPGLGALPDQVALELG